MKNFALIGAAGYIATRHMKAIKDTGNNLIAALDRFDSVGIIDSYFPNAHFFTEPERFDRHLYKIKRHDTPIDFISICSPNYLHDAHIRLSLRNNADAICEKPLVLNPWNIDALVEIEESTKQKIYNILQLRLHPSIIALKKKVDNAPDDKIYDIDLSYLTSRGNWYFTSWKGDQSKSGGISTNIGIHFFDMLTWIFGPVEKSISHINDKDKAAGFLQLKNARVRWFLSVNYDLIPENIKESGQRTFRSITVDGEEIEFSGGFTDLHTTSYQQILDGNGFGLLEAKPSIDIVHQLRNSPVSALVNEYHPFCK
ncbi:MAG: Gfo/Idh/MocA family protein [Flavobacteriales bacterium]